MTDVTTILNAIEAGNARTEELLPLVYEELRRLALALNISRATASRWWNFAKAWLFQRVQGKD